MVAIRDPNIPTGDMIMANIRLLDKNGEALYGRPVIAYMSKNEIFDDIATSVIRIYDPFTGISAGPSEDLKKLVCLTSAQGFVWVQIPQPSMALFKITVAGLTTLTLESSYDIYGDPHPLVGIMDTDTNKWIILDAIKKTEIIQQVPSTIGSFNRFELKKAAIPGKIIVESLIGGALQEYNIGNAKLGVTFRKQHLPKGFFVYDRLSNSLFVSDDSIVSINVEYEVPPFTIANDTDFRPRNLIPDPEISAEGIDLTTANLAIYPDVKAYLHFNHIDTILKTAIVIFQNPLSKLEESKRYAEG